MLACAGLLAFSGVAHALDDLPLFYDFYCDGRAIPQSSLDVGAVNVTVNNKFNCSDFYQGTNSWDLEIPTDVQESGYYYSIMKFGDDGKHALTGMKDVRFMVKNLNGTAETMRMVVQDVGNTNYNATGVAIPASKEWTEVIVPLTKFSGYTEGMLIQGFGFRLTSPDALPGSALHLLFDQIRFTDGTGGVALDVPALPGGMPPTNWPNYLMVGRLDARANSDKSNSAALQVGDYRYEYIMSKTFVDWGDAKYAQTYAEISRDFGIKSGFVWYNLGDAGEGAVAQNLANSAYMTDYVNRYEDFLSQLKAADQSDYIIVLEPDMYGVLLQKGFAPNLSCTDVPVYMDRANAVVSGKNYSGNLCGWADYMMGRARELLPKGVIIGHMLNHWGVNIPGQVGRGRIEAHLMGGLAQGKFLNSFSATGKGDVVFVERCHRDAGTENNADWFWDDESYGRYFAWVKTLSAKSNLRVVGWQVSEGNMNHPVAANRDNSGEHFLAHKDLWAKAGFIGVLFGAGLQGQANYMSGENKGHDNDGGWFLQKMNAYAADPFSLANISSPIVRLASRAYDARPLRACGNALCATAAVEIRNIAGIRMGSLQAGERLEMQSGLYFWRAGATAGSVRVP